MRTHVGIKKIKETHVESSLIMHAVFSLSSVFAAFIFRFSVQ